MAQRPSPTLANAVAPGVRVPKIEPLQRRIERNRWRFVIFMVLFTSAAAMVLFTALVLVVLVVMTLAFGIPGDIANGPGGGALTLWTVVAVTLATSLAVAWAWSLARLSRSEATLIHRLGARVSKAGTLLSTKSALRDMSIAAGLPKTPQLYVIDVRGVNAFVLGRSPDNVRIGVTTGMLERICVDEQRAVFANLIARVLSADTLWATAVSALMGPVWAMRDYDLGFEPKKPGEPARMAGGRVQPRDQDWRTGGIVVYGLAVILTEFLSWYHQEAAWSASEKADAEGMMLLKDPRSMLRAIENVLERNNHVPTAGDAYSQLFFCWAGYGFAPEDDPEMRRVARLRETLGAEGAPYIPRPNVPGWPTAPPPPRIELLAEIGGSGGGTDAG